MSFAFGIPQKISQVWKCSADKKIFFFVLLWLAGYFFSPTNKFHYQLFLLIFLSISIWLIIKGKVNFSGLLESKVFVVAGLYCAFYLLSLFWADGEMLSSRFQDFRRTLYLYIFWVVILYVLNGSQQKLELMFKVLIGAAVISFVLNAGIFYGLNDSGLEDRFAGLGRLWNPLFSGAIFGAMSLLTLMLLLGKYKIFSTTQRLSLMLAYAVFFSATLLSHSRTPIAAMLLMSFLALLFSQFSVKAKIGGVIGGLLGLLAMFMALMPFFEKDITRGQSRRLELFSGFWERVKEHLLLGHGGGTKVEIIAKGEFVDGWHDYHNIYLGSLVELGLVGLILHIGLIVTGLFIAWSYRTQIYVAIAASIFVFACLIGLTFGEGLITRLNIQWFLFWMPLVVISMYELKLKGVSIRKREPKITTADKNSF